MYLTIVRIAGILGACHASSMIRGALWFWGQDIVHKPQNDCYAAQIVKNHAKSHSRDFTGGCRIDGQCDTRSYTLAVPRNARGCVYYSLCNFSHVKPVCSDCTYVYVLPRFTTLYLAGWNSFCLLHDHNMLCYHNYVMMSAYRTKRVFLLTS